MAIYSEHGHCFACGYHPTDPIELYQKLTGERFSKAVRSIYYRFPVRTEKVSVSKPKRIPLSLVEDWLGNMDSSRWAFLNHRYGILRTDDLEKLIGYTGTAYAFIHRDYSGNPIGAKFRIDEQKYPDSDVRYWNLKNYPTPYPFPANLVKEYAKCEVSRILLCEGEADALAAIGIRIPAVCTPSGVNSKVNNEFWGPLWEALGSITVYVAFDNDEAGEQAWEKVREVLSGLGIDCQRLRPSGGKDVAESIRLYGKLKGW